MRDPLRGCPRPIYDKHDLNVLRGIGNETLRWPRALARDPPLTVRAKPNFLVHFARDLCVVELSGVYVQVLRGVRGAAESETLAARAAHYGRLSSVSYVLGRDLLKVVGVALRAGASATRANNACSLDVELTNAERL